MEWIILSDSVFFSRFYVLTNTITKEQEIFGSTLSWKD